MQLPTEKVHNAPDVPAGHEFVGYSREGKVITATGGLVHDDGYEAEEERIHNTRRTTFLIGWARRRRTGATREILDQAEGLVSAEDWEQVEQLLEPVEEAYDDWMTADIKRCQTAERRWLADMTRQRRLEDARRRTPPKPVRDERPMALASPRERRDNGARRRTSGQDPGDDSEEAEPPKGGFELTFVDRAPALWRLRAARCRLLEIREGVDR